MARLSEVEAHRAQIQALVTLAQRDLLAIWGDLNPDDAPGAVRQLLAVIPDLVEVYGSSAAETAALWFEDLRAEANQPGTFTARLADPPPPEQVDALARWAVGPLFSATPDAAKALSLLAGGMQRAIVSGDRGTIAVNAQADGAVWSRHASPNACTFCRMLATRDAVYGSEESALRVVGRGKGPRARGVRELGSKYHDHCHCAAVPTWPGQTLQRAPYVDAWETAYTDATRAVGGDTTAILAHMREALGSA